MCFFDVKTVIKLFTTLEQEKKFSFCCLISTINIQIHSVVLGLPLILFVKWDAVLILHVYSLCSQTKFLKYLQKSKNQFPENLFVLFFGKSFDLLLFCYGKTQTRFVFYLRLVGAFFGLEVFLRVGCVVLFLKNLRFVSSKLEMILSFFTIDSGKLCEQLSQFVVTVSF